MRVIEKTLSEGGGGLILASEWGLLLAARHGAHQPRALTAGALLRVALLWAMAFLPPPPPPPDPCGTTLPVARGPGFGRRRRERTTAPARLVWADR